MASFSLFSCPLINWDALSCNTVCIFFLDLLINCLIEPKAKRFSDIINFLKSLTDSMYFAHFDKVKRLNAYSFLKF